ncbi:hypothetical protein PhCBS80983_g05861 [Powellomyces hirtus]|uniref:Uncharacterized protein n=1 Tax=Powellomyces hirtus TaxID=109895 RepID=A0A507DT08_9FUNG|nr:hypothetical protein PhCBS80983_g05861 [Powellomyces hirtus]
MSDEHASTTLPSLLAGYLSILCWLLVFTPQLYHNYKRKSTEGLSLVFILTWLLGDLCSFAGAWINKLLPTLIGLSLYYAVVECFLLFQMWYYRKPKSSSIDIDIIDDEERCNLLSNNTSLKQPPLPLPPSTVPTYGSNSHTSLSSSPPSTPTLAASPTTTRLCMITAGLLILNVAGRASSGSHVDSSRVWSTNTYAAAHGPSQWEMAADVLGYVSALLYIGARFPQIYLNATSRSCHGLSMLMFGFSVLGNTTYCASIFLQSTDPDYITLNLPWIAGSAGTLFLDFVVLGQFYYYRDTTPSTTNINTNTNSPHSPVTSSSPRLSATAARELEESSPFVDGNSPLGS